MKAEKPNLSVYMAQSCLIKWFKGFCFLINKPNSCCSHSWRNQWPEHTCVCVCVCVCVCGNLGHSTNDQIIIQFMHTGRRGAWSLKSAHKHTQTHTASLCVQACLLHTCTLCVCVCIQDVHACVRVNTVHRSVLCLFEMTRSLGRAS